VQRGNSGKATRLPLAFFRSQAAAYVLLPLASLCWAGNHVIARAAGHHVPPASLAVIRWLIVLLLLVPFAWPHLSKDWPKIERHFGLLTLLAITGGGAFGTLQFVALHFTSAINMGVFSSVAPAFIVAASYILFGDRLRPLQLIGVCVSLTGVLAIVTHLDPSALLRLDINFGDLIIIANMTLWALYSACLRLRPEIHPLSFLSLMAAIAGLGNLPFAAWEYAVDYRLEADVLTVATILYAALFTTVLAYISWHRGVELIGAPTASAFLHTIPLFGAALATTLLGEPLRAYHIAGFVLIVCGVSLAARRSAASPHA
jgi:drug/metabolite transporter (DMT)-like permease